MPKFRWFLLAALIVHLGILLQWNENLSLYSVASSPALASVSLSFAQSSNAQEEVTQKKEMEPHAKEKPETERSERIGKNEKREKTEAKKSQRAQEIEKPQNKIVENRHISEKIKPAEIHSPQKKVVKEVEENNKKKKKIKIQKKNKNNKIDMSENEINQQDMSPSEEPTEELYIGQENAVSYALFVPPKYPSRAIAQGIAGQVLLRVFVSENGRAHQVEVLKSSHPIFIKEARKSAMKSTYTPMKKNGQITQSWVRIPIRFELR